MQVSKGLYLAEEAEKQKKVAMEDVKRETEDLQESSKAMRDPAKRRWRVERRDELRAREASWAQEAQPHRPAGRLQKKRFASPVSWLPRPMEEAASKVGPPKNIYLLFFLTNITKPWY